MPGHHGQSGTSMGVSQGHSHSTSGNDNNYQDRIQRVASGVEPGHRPTDARPHGLSPEEAHRQGKITKDQMNQAIDNPGLDTSDNYQEKVGFWDQVTNAASEFIESGGLVGNVIKLGGDVLSKLGDYSSSLQKKAMTYHLENQITNIGNKKDFHPGAYGYKIQDIQKDIDAIERGDFKQSDFNEKYGSPEISVGGGEGDRDVMNMIAPAAPYIVGGTTPQESQAAKWYASLGTTQNNGFGFSFANEFAAAKQKQAGILGNPSPVGMLAVNNSPFYNFLKDRNLDKGIL
tara:strand:- start:510 stop:1373 length:864 start_codon:yes stop_codon:yes gene_type:complete